MKRLFPFFLFTFLVCASAFAQGGGQPIIIPIPNPSFELGYGNCNSQDLGVSPRQLQNISSYFFTDGVYQLSFVVQNDSSSLSYPGYFQGEIDFGTQELCPFEGWGTHGFTQITVVCPSPAYIVVDQALPGGGPVQGANDLMLKSCVPTWSWPIKFNNVQMTFMPQS